jgi:pyrroline-5-carboxylate reductase
MLRGFIESGAVAADAIGVVSRSEAGRGLAVRLGARVYDEAAALARDAEMTILAVKPKDAPATLVGCRAALNNKALLSIVAGLTYQAIYRTLSDTTTRVLVALPNLALRVGAGVVGLTEETTFTPDEKKTAESLFSAGALVVWVQEKLLGALSALSGSAPAYAAMFMEALADGAVAEGLPRKMSYQLAAKTVLGTAKMLLTENCSPADIKDMVSSPGGTTIEGVDALERAAFRAGVIAAVRAGSAKFRAV